ncbi:MAG TPA: hypothetical protein VHS52_02945, partial [Acidimicrobiales bacterium]|nr:hypothetical protein [Acidimicrobiales bacterium]
MASDGRRTRASTRGSGTRTNSTPRGNSGSGELVSGQGGPNFTQGGIMPGGGQMENWRENPLDPMAPIGVRSRAVERDSSILRLGPLEKIYLIWMVGG